MYNRLLFPFSHCLVAGSGNYIHLLFLCQVNKLHCIAGYADGKVGVLLLLRMVHSVNELLRSEHVYIQMVRTLVKIAVHHLNQIFNALRLIMAQCIRIDGLGVGDTVQRPLIG